MKLSTETDKKKPKKDYTSTVQSLLDIWKVLDLYSSVEHPLSVADIAEILKNKSKDAPSPNTISRMLPSQVSAVEQLHPHKALQKENSPSVIQTYTSENTLHIVVESRDGEIFREDDLTVIVEQKNNAPPSYSTIDKLLKQFLDSGYDDFPFKLKCVRAVSKNGRTRYIPYSDWEDTFTDQTRNNQPRRYYLESVLTPAEWRIFSDLVQVYPYISQNQTEKFLNVLKRISPGGISRINSRYAFKRGDSKQFQNIAILDKAIKNRKAVMVQYGKYILKHVDGIWKPVLTPREKGAMKIKPYALIWSNGYYYLVGKHYHMMNLRVDRIISVAEIDESFERDSSFDPFVYRDRSPVMYSGRNQYVKMRCKLTLMNTLLDVFGSQTMFSAPIEDWTEVTLPSVAPEGVKLFAMEYADSVEVLEPATLREDIRDSLDKALKQYN